jgi:hypothetical protein
VLLGGTGAAALYTGLFGLIEKKATTRHEDQAKQAEARSAACAKIGQALEDEASAIDGAAAAVITQGEGEKEKPLHVTKDYREAVKHARATGGALNGALANFVAVGLQPPPDDNIPAMVSDINIILVRLPGKLLAKQNTEQDWGALPDRRNRFRELVPMLAKQCGAGG